MLRVHQVRAGVGAAIVAGVALWAQTPQGGRDPRTGAPPPEGALPANRATTQQAQPARRANSFLISRPVPTQEQVDRGQKIYTSNCGFCHGANAKGGESGPDLIRSVVALRDENGELIGPIIKHGRPERGMPAFPLNDTQIQDIAAFLRNRQQAAINRGDYKIQNVVTGDAHKGEAFFNGAGGCAKCHSVSGDLKGIASKYDPTALQARFLYPETRSFPGAPEDRRTPAKPKSVVVTLPSGEKFSGNLDYVDDYDVALRDASGAYHSFARTDGVKVNIEDPLRGHEELLSKYTDADVHNVLAYLVTLK